MLFTKFLVAAAAFTLASSQQVSFTNSDFSGIKVGVPFTITWSGASSDITLKLKNGPSDQQILVSSIATGVSGTSFAWVPASTLAPGTYNLEIDHGSDLPNYSQQFQITGGSGSSSAISSASAATGLSSSAIPSLASSAISSAAPTGSSTITTAAASTSSASGKSNSISTTTVASNATASVTTTVTRSSGTSTSTAVPSANNAAQYASPFAFVLLSFAAMAALN